MEINFRILGETAIRVDDRFVVTTQSKPLGMLSVLLLRSHRLVSVDELIDWIWPEDKIPNAPAPTLHTYRKRITSALDQMESPPKIVVRGGAYRLDVDREEIDFHEFCDRAQRARMAARLSDHASAVLMLKSAVDELWTGLPLPDLGGPRAANWRRMAEADHLVPAHGALLLSLCTLGEYEEVLHRISDLPVELQSNLTLVKQRITALRGLQRFQDASTCALAHISRLYDEGDDDGAEELKRFYDELTRYGQSQPPIVLGSPPPAEVLHLLPHDVPDFMGREALLASLDNFTTARGGEPPATIIVLTGQPGVGKTALALHWAHRAASKFPGGRFYKNLAGFAGGPKVEQAEVVADLLTALGFPADGIPSETGRLAKLRSLLSGPRALVVLDNVRDPEHVLPLLDYLSNCTVVLTSRQWLGRLTQAGAFSLPVPPLNFVDSKKWLVKWLGARAELETVATGDLAELCDGVALALRIVADHVASRPGVPLGEFADELWDEQALLTLGDHGGGPDGSVRAALSWSYHALDPREQRLFRLLGINPGPDISLAAAAALLGQDSRTTKKSLDVLVDSQLLSQPESRSRYTLHDLLRRYARALVVGSEDFAAAEERLLGFFLATAQNADEIIIPGRERVDIPPTPEGVVPLEFPDEKSAIRWVIRERTNSIALLKYADRNGLDLFVSKFPSVAGEIWIRLGHGFDTAMALRLAVKRAQNLDSVEELAFSKANLGYTLINLRDFDSAWEVVASAKVLLEKLGNAVDVAIMDHLLGRLWVERGEFHRGIEIQLSALAEFRRLGATDREVVALYRLGEAYRRAHNLEAAASYSRDALWVADRTGEDLHTKGCAFAELANIHFERGDYVDAKDYCRRALEIHEPDNPAQSGKVHAILAAIYLDQGELHTAEQSARRALTYSRRARDSRGQAVALDTMAELLYRQGRHEEAADSWKVALSFLDAAGDRHLAATVRGRLAEVGYFGLEVPQERTESIEIRHTRDFTR